jgi:hypothetical protein
MLGECRGEVAARTALYQGMASATPFKAAKRLGFSPWIIPFIEK